MKNTSSPTESALNASGDALLPYKVQTPRSEGLTNEFSEMETLLSDLHPGQWDTECTLAGATHTVGWIARHVLHDGLHHLADIGRVRAALGHGPLSATGTVTGLHVSNGGVPKTSVDSVTISAAGVVGDAQNDRRHHGRPVQAVCLWSADVISDLQSEGHPIHAGAAGENVTVSGVPWSKLRPGGRIDVGALRLMISAHAIPCGKNAQWFNDRDFNLFDKKKTRDRAGSTPSLSTPRWSSSATK